MLSDAVAADEFITATATNLSTHDTSEFAFNVTAVAGSDSDSDGVLDVAEDRDLDTDSDPATGAPLDTDGDSTRDYLDTDDDGRWHAEPPVRILTETGTPLMMILTGTVFPTISIPMTPDRGLAIATVMGSPMTVECPSRPPCTDTDGDGIPNYNDPDHNTLVKRLTIDATGRCHRGLDRVEHRLGGG